jgi:formate/nitrite transporter FocA (FNT family)
MENTERRKQLGSSDAPVEDALEESFDRIVDEGAQRLHRTWLSMFVTGTFGGLEVGVGVMAYLAVLHESDNHLLAGLAFSIGFIALLLAKSELFTEGFLVPITAVAAKEASVAKLAKLWAATLSANLVSGLLFMWLVMTAFPQWASTVTKSATAFVDAGFTLQSVCLAVLGGSTITLMTRMQHGTDSVVAKIIAAIGGAFLLSALPLFHSVLDSLLIFGAMWAGAPITGWDWLGWFSYTVVFNVVGGVVLVTALRLLRSRELLEQRRREAPENPDLPRR